MMDKKGVIESQFNWIFVFVIGALILLFFVGFVTTQKQQSEQRIGEKIAKDLNTIITQTSVSTGRADVVNIPNKAIEFNCDPEGCGPHGCTSGFTISGTNVGWDTPVQPIFSPDLVKGMSLLSWSLEWSMPYHATNFLYLTSPQVRYVFVGGSGLINELYNELPATINKELSSSTISNKNNYKVKIISDSVPTLPPALVSIPDKDVVAIVIEEVDDESGKLIFYKKQGSGFLREGNADDVWYIGRPLLYGAIFSEDRANYECNMKKALLRLHMATKVYKDVADELSQTQPLVCQSHYDYATISQIDSNTQDLDLQKASTIYQNAVKVRGDNHNLKIYSCPLIY